MEGISRIPLTLALLSHWLTWHRAYSAPPFTAKAASPLTSEQHSPSVFTHQTTLLTLPLKSLCLDSRGWWVSLLTSISRSSSVFHLNCCPQKVKIQINVLTFISNYDASTIHHFTWPQHTQLFFLNQQSLILLRKIKKRNREEGGEVRSPQFGCYSRGSPCWNDLELLKGALLAFLKVEAVHWSRYGFSEHQSSSL